MAPFFPNVVSAPINCGIGTDQLPPGSPNLLPLDPAAEDNRARTVEQMVGPISPGLVEDTGTVLFRDLWLRQDLAPRDRRMVTVAALIKGGQFAQLSYHLGRVMDNGLTRSEASEMVSPSGLLCRMAERVLGGAGS
ncbi:carboxymuconolactone decarboxylase family protein [Paraburkholderia sp. MM5384-R2]|uniref:carboxymuconolactone decarboxylase family protein n=1 Tax=Paraburkholderia sp. MM5384-R2 TaxID=2723097 RepID=UPI0017EB4A21|nr:carboxymuconolactone decarboxylase family protein [Paraburkholderia sp. MM5384-R2]MBB5498852.1 alkylhydroperoxidase/carboxymuconolactone decarboxylase family protein YurZ [Paraburkholderia sp. MM5384-R2]